ncbi:MAG TPA: hypothetical protein V6C58_09340, partial [Allocoleopsis sp.]
LLTMGNISYSWQNLVVADPTNTAFDKTEVQFNGWENPLINISFCIPTNNIPPSTMTWELWNSFVKNEYVGTTNTKTILNIIVGEVDTSLISYATDTSTQNIPVQIKGYTLNFGPGDSDKGSFWIINAQLVETK